MARPPWCSPPLSHSLLSSYIYQDPWPLQVRSGLLRVSGHPLSLPTFRPTKRQSKPSFLVSTQRYYSHSVSLCTLLLHTQWPLPGIHPLKFTFHQVMSLSGSTPTGLEPIPTNSTTDQPLGVFILPHGTYRGHPQGYSGVPQNQELVLRAVGWTFPPL
ncbi:unnamed protein product [Ectocarpus sp. 6 AP-2014]